MITRRMRIQIAIFVIIAVTGIAYAGAQYAGLGRLIGIHGYVVTVRLADSGGIFSNAEVTYRGVTVGRVGALNLTESGIDVELDIDPSAPPIPASSRAVIANRSAVGEQYVDLEPTNDNGPMLGNGSVIPQNRTSIPLAPQTLLADLDQLAASVPANSLHTVVDELDTAFNGAGPDLQKLLDSADSLTTTASQHLPQTSTLLADGRVVLNTQQAEAAQLGSFSSGLDLLAQQLQKSDPDIRRVIGQAPVVASQIDELLRTSGTDLGVTLANLLTTAKITSTRAAGLAQMLVEFPIAVAAAPSADPDGTGHLGFVLDFFDPMPCTQGYQTTHERPGNDTTPQAPNNAAYCASPPQTGIDVRGSNNAPFGGMPTQATAPGGTGGGQPTQTGTQTQPGGAGLTGTPLGATTLATLLGIS